jgi:hypothetical protein
MRLIAFLAAIAVLFCLTEASSAQTVYSGMVTTASLSGAEAPSAREAGLRLLTWPGKTTEAPRPRQAYAPQRRYWNPEPSAPPAQAYAYAPAPEPRPQAALPSSIYAPPPPAYAPSEPVAQPAPMRQAAAAPAAMAQAGSPPASDYEPPHFYSLYSEYGQRPDPIPKTEFDPRSPAPAASVPLNAQFFAATTPDMASPPPAVPQQITTSGGRVVETVPPSPDDNPG